MKMPVFSRILRGLISGAIATTPLVASAQTVFQWNNTSTDANAPGSWDPAGLPGVIDLALFKPDAGTNLLPLNPALAVNSTIGAILLGNDSLGGTFSLNGNAHTLSLPAATPLGAPAAITVRGYHAPLDEFSGDPRQYAVRNLSALTVGAPASPLGRVALDVGHSSAFVATGVAMNFMNENVVLRGGLLALEDRATGAATLSTSGDIVFSGGGSELFFFGTTSGGPTAITPASGALRLASGDAKVRMQEAITANSVTFGSLVQTNIASTIDFETNVPIGFRPFHLTTDPVRVNGVISSNISGLGYGVGFATFSGDNFAAYSDRVTPVVPAILSAPLVNPTIPATTNGEINTSASIAPGVNFSLNTLVLRPFASGEVLTLGASSVLNTSAILLPRFVGYGYTIEGGSIAGTTPRYVQVRAPGDQFDFDGGIALKISSNFAPGAPGSSLPLIKAGAGFLTFTGATDQVNFGNDQPIAITGGTLRGSIVTFGAIVPNFGTNNVIQLRGGVFEVDSSLTSAFAPTFLERRVGQTRGVRGGINWSPTGSANALAGGSGGFSAIGGALDVFLYNDVNVRGGRLTWDQTEGFLREGHALIFGSVQTDGSPVIWHNELGLDNTEPSHRYSPREIQVLAKLRPVGDGGLEITPAVADFVAPIRGIEKTDLQKTGRGTLKLSAVNTYTGETLVNEGTLALVGDGGSGQALGTTSAIVVKDDGQLPNYYGSELHATLSLLHSDQIGDTVPLSLSGAFFNTNGLQETLGTLTVGGTMTNPFENDISVLDLGTLDPSLLQDVIHFANSALKQWSGRLSIYNWNGDNAGYGTDQVFFGADPTGLTAAQLDRISFYEGTGQNFLGTAHFLPSGEIVPNPVPEPTAGLLVVAGALGFLRRRRGA